MKNLLIIIAFSLLAGNPAFCQSNLMFSQVINIYNGQSYTVPAGKVFKLESFTQSDSRITYNYISCQVQEGFANCNYGINLFTIGSLSDSATYTYTSGSQCGYCPQTYSVGQSLPAFTFPIWLKAGTVVSLANGMGMLMTGIEFSYQ